MSCPPPSLGADASFGSGRPYSCGRLSSESTRLDANANPGMFSRWGVQGASIPLSLNAGAAVSNRPVQPALGLTKRTGLRPTGSNSSNFS